MCTVSLFLSENPLPHVSQTCGLAMHVRLTGSMGGDEIGDGRCYQIFKPCIHTRMHRMSLADAVEKRDIDGVVAMLQNPAVKNTIEQTKCMGDEDVGMTPLCIAVHLRDFPMVRLLLKNGANVNGCSGYTVCPPRRRNPTPLSTAAGNFDVDMVKLLLEAGADVNSKQSSHGMTAMCFVPIAKSMRCDTSPDVEREYLTGHNDCLDIIRLLVAAGADINVPSIIGESILHSSVHMNNDYGKPYQLDNTIGTMCLQEIKVLVELGADVNGIDTKGHSVLYYAVDSNFVDAVKLLVELGADVNAIDNHGRSALHYAVKNYNVEGVFNLIECGANVDVKDKYGHTPLHYTSQVDFDSSITKMLIKHGADVFAKDRKGRTPSDFKCQVLAWETIKAEQTRILRHVFAMGHKERKDSRPNDSIVRQLDDDMFRKVLSHV
jgi:ankyrin repeat protein